MEAREPHVLSLVGLYDPVSETQSKTEENIVSATFYLYNIIFLSWENIHYIKMTLKLNDNSVWQGNLCSSQEETDLSSRI